MERRYAWQGKRPAGNLVCSRDGVSQRSERRKGLSPLRTTRAGQKGGQRLPESAVKSGALQPPRDTASTNREQFGKLKC